MTARPAAGPAWRAPLWRAAAAVHLVIAGLLVVYLVGSLLLTGGQVVASRGPIWGAALDFPLFVVPAWMLIALAAVGAALYLPLLLTVRVLDARRLSGAWGVVAASVFTPLLFSAVVDDDIWRAFREQGYWIASAISAVCVLALAIAAFTTAPRYDRLARAGELPPGYL
ncbi:hypothetical protein ACFQRL_00660 [Microbacterium fluvii]|uniref:Uncharacterized protein n=1 Tax=Microbacterium fluvii TaxID=415215 RepID=A0ABW2HDE6_9MICO|nr:hypothetical protein [Microbacterium fluvii]MCU4671097.1 hypothetical protein [Microbacterium fluvii]